MDGERGEAGEPGPSLSLAKFSVLALGGARLLNETADAGVSGIGVLGDLGIADIGVGKADAGVAGDLGIAETGVDAAEAGVTGVQGSLNL